MIIEKIKKRSGDIVNFDAEKIAAAIKKAFIGHNVSIAEDRLENITKHVVKHIERHFVEILPSVEDVQNIVERVLIEEGFYDVAKAYILYRYEHAKVREHEQKEIRKKIEKNALYVIKRNGKREKFQVEKIKKALEYAAKDAGGDIEINSIAEQCQNELFDNIETRLISNALILAVRSWIEKDPAYSKIASRLLCHSIYKEVIGSSVFKNSDSFEENYRSAFIKSMNEGVRIGRFDPKLLEFDLTKLSRCVQPSRDDHLLYLGLQTLYDRYLTRHPESKQLLETPQMLWMRVAMGLAIQEQDKDKYVEIFYDSISTLRFMPSTPTLFHAGTIHPQLSSCYLTTISDSLDHIFKCVADNAQLSKWSGGLGNDWTNIRATGSLIQGTGVDSQGVIPFLKIANDTTVAINRSGRRRGATCAYLETWHLDIEDFLELRKNTGDERRRTHDMNTANWIPDLFMKRLEENAEWTLFSPDETPDLHHLYGKKFEERYKEYEKMSENGKLKMFKKVKAVDLWKKMITMLFETGHPWITFKDPCNIRSPQDHCGIIHSSNLCTEITLNTSSEETAVCNLGSVNLTAHMSDGHLDKKLLENTIKTAVRMLDNVIDINFYPTAEAKYSNLQHRPIGLGIMGFQDCLYMMNYTFDSENAVDFADQSMELIAYHAILTSAQLAKERGAYATFKHSKWDRGILPVDTLELLKKERGLIIEVDKSVRLDWEKVRSEIKKYGMRNSNCIAIAPTATISNMVGCVPSIEPIYKNIYVKSNMSGEFTITNPYLVKDLKEVNLWNQDILDEIKAADGNIQDISIISENIRKKYKEAFDIDPRWLIKIAAHRGKWIDQSQSLNLFIKSSSGKLISDVYMHAWKMGLKTTYYLRTLSATNIEKSTLSLIQQNRQHRNFPNPAPQCKVDDPTCEVCQ